MYDYDYGHPNLLTLTHPGLTYISKRQDCSDGVSLHLPHFPPACACNSSLIFTLTVPSGHPCRKIVKWQYFEYEHCKNK